MLKRICVAAVKEMFRHNKISTSAQCRFTKDDWEYYEQ